MARVYKTYSNERQRTEPEGLLLPAGLGQEAVFKHSSGNG